VHPLHCNQPVKKDVVITDFARTYQPATDMSYVDTMILKSEDTSNFNEDMHTVDELITKGMTGSLANLNHDTQEACKLGATSYTKLS
jgi:hypothetical protein